MVMAMTVATVVAEITMTATDSSPTYITARKANRTAKNPPAAPRDIRIEMTIPAVGAATRKNVNTRSTVSAKDVTDPTCDG
jgi:hypothetical protein